MPSEIHSLYEALKNEFEELETHHTKYVEKGVKAAGKRSRKCISNIQKLLTPYRKASIQFRDNL